MKTKIIFTILIYSILLISCKSKQEKTEEDEELTPNTVEMNDGQYKMAGIELGKIEEKVLGNTLKVNGLVSVPPQNLVSVSVRMGGYVKSTDLVQGSPVTKGQVIAVIENAEFIELQQNYLENKNRLEFVEADYNRQKDLFKENINSVKTYQQSLAEYKSLKTKVSAFEQKLALIGIDAKQLQDDKISRTISVYAPISGYIKTVNINIGKFVNPSDVIFEIVNNQKLTLELTVFEKDIDKIIIGQKIRFSQPNKPGKEQYAVIYQVGKSIGEDKTIKAYAYVDNEDKNLLPGMYVNALIETSNNTSTAIPEEAILTFDDKNYIFIFKERKQEGKKFVTLFQMIEVKKGITNNGFSEIILPKDFDIEKNKIVIKGAYNLLSALKNAGDMAC